jgi:hypothetical protein
MMSSNSQERAAGPQRKSGFNHFRQGQGFFMLGLFLMTLALWTSYRYYVRNIRLLNYQIFDVKKNISWVEDTNGIYRRDARATEDNLLLSFDRFREIDLSFFLINPRDCGIIYQYENSKNLSFIYFSKEAGSIVWGKKESGEVKQILRLPYPFHELQSCQFSVRNGQAQLSINKQVFPAMATAGTAARIGLIVNDAIKPITVFHNIQIRGILDSGAKVAGSCPPVFSQAAGKYIIFLFPLFLSILLSGLYLAYWAKGCKVAMLKNPSFSKEELSVNRLTAIAIHFLLACCVFWPFLTQGRVLISSYDNIGEIYPLFFFSKHNFEQLLHGQGLSLWNSFAHNGVPLFNNHWNMIYYPFNWLIFLFPDAQVMSLLTLKIFLETFLLGVFAYGFFALELGNPAWALFSSICYQLCSLLIFSFSIFPTTAAYFAMIFYLYLLWSMPQRRAIWNYLFLTFAVVLVLTAANMAFTFYAILSLVVISSYRILSLDRDRKESFSIMMASGVTGFLISAIRILPCTLGIEGSNRLIPHYYTIQDRAMMFLRFFIPEITGWLGSGSFNALLSERLNLIFRLINLPSNSQNSFFVYFGIFGGMLLLASIVVHQKGKFMFWKIYAWVTIALALLVQPFWGILSVLFFPFNHYSYHTIFLPVGICALLGYTGMVMERGKISPKRQGKKVITLLLLVQCYLLVVLTYLFPKVTFVSRTVFYLLFLGTLIYFALKKGYRELVRPYFTFLIIGINIALSSFLFVAVTALLLRPIPKKEGVVEHVLAPSLIPFLIILIALAFFLLLLQRKRIVKGQLIMAGFLFLNVPILSGWLMTTDIFQKLLNAEEPFRVYFIDIFFAQVKLLLIIQIGILAWLTVRLRLISRKVFMVLILGILTLDLVAFNLRFDNITAPFFSRLAFYPKDFKYEVLQEDVRKQLDLVNYRVSSLHKTGINANKNMIYGLPSYTGTIGYMPARFAKLIINFGYPGNTVLIYPEDETQSERLLDLSAIKYTFENASNFRIRPNALSRLGFYYSYEVINDDNLLLQRLKADDFDPLKDVLLSEQPRTGSPFGVDRKAKIVPISQISSDEIRAVVETDAPGVILFTESYDRGWKAWVDQVPAPVLIANYNFMALYLAPGRHEIRFNYQPESYKLALRLSFGGLVICVLGIVIGIILSWRRRKTYSISGI